MPRPAIASPTRISESLVSRHVAELEKSLGVYLVNRTARTISLTEAGTRYAEFATRIVEEIDREEAQLRGLRDKGRPIVWTEEPVFGDEGRRWTPAARRPGAGSQREGTVHR